ncbi:MAG: ACP S-malonyltransferase [Holosporales bacterium]|jgi:[acyl-carrier-protein] S-malonyltransferase|nr:ACP S-malonyltransferase [Holosporales bacterium]
MAKALIFPGQGSQKVGMASALISGFPSGKRVMEEVEEAISFNLSNLIDKGPIQELTKTEYAQPAIFAVGMMCVTILKEEFGYDLKKFKYLAGHSLGEYTALCAAGVISISDGVKLVKIRGDLMSEVSSDGGDYKMVALVGVGAEDIEPILAKYVVSPEVCVIANDNSPTQVVISGHTKAILKIISKAKKKMSTIKAITLNTSGPFHSPIMGKIAIKFDQILQKHRWNKPEIPVIMNATARPVENKLEISLHLLSQMLGRVRWREIIEFLLNDPNITEIVEIAPGKVLSTMVKRSYPDTSVSNIETITQIEEFISKRGTE